MIKKIHMISVPMDLGANIPGSGGGPDSLDQMIRELRLFENSSFDLFKSQIKIPPRKNSKDKNLKEITQVCSDLKDEVYSSLKKGFFPLSFGGDHSLAIGSVFGVKSFCEEKGLRLGVLWFDAHADMNTPESSETGNIHGMPLASLLGMGHKPLLDLAKEKSFVKAHEVALIGLRDVDLKEQVIVDQSGVFNKTMEECRKMGIEKLANTIKETLLDHVDALHFSFDLDVMDPKLAPSVSTPVRNGMTLQEFEILLAPVLESKKLISLDFVEYNPLNEKEGRGLECSRDLLNILF